MKIILLTKPPIAGYAKTRLIDPLTAEQAAAVHAAMVRCTTRRLVTAFGGGDGHDLVLALDHPSPTCGPKVGNWLADAPREWRIVDQGPGNLGDRLDHIWREDADTPTLFFGTDTPDVPLDLLRSIPDQLGGGDACIGPSEDGGYWTLGSHRRCAELVREIDWGTTSVYHQTLEAAKRGRLKLQVLDAWNDVDDIHDLVLLRQRLADAGEAALIDLREDLDALLGEPHHERPKRPGKRCHGRGA